MSVTPGFNGIQPPEVNQVAADFRTAFLSDIAPYSSVMNQYAVPSSRPPIVRMSEAATRLAKYAESFPENESNGMYQGPFPNLSFAYGRG